ncbi:MAG: 3'-5' exonuclease [archaeon]|nr:3'-5' exonuclease [archaeon]
MASEESRLDFDFFLVLDFEATCQEGARITPQEVIEFPVVCVCAKSRAIVWELQNYVKPVVHPRLSPFCTSLTGITQDTVDAGISFPAALDALTAKMRETGLLPVMPSSPRFIFVTCGDWDLQVMLSGQLRLSNLKRPSFFNQWINIKQPFMTKYRQTHSLGMAAMLKVLKMKMVGRHHSGIDDCRNIAAILLRMIADSTALKATKQLR